MHAKKKTADAAYQDLTKNIDISVLQENVRVFFSQFPDPRKSERVIYPAWYIILVILCSYLSGCNTISDIAHFAEIKNGWLNTLLGLNFRPVSYDTIWWFFVRVKPEAFKELMTEWIGALSGNMRDQLLAIDGKRLRGVSNQDHISHLVELFATESKLVIAQKKVPDKKCERTALPALLGSIDVSWAIISITLVFLLLKYNLSLYPSMYSTFLTVYSMITSAD